MFIFIKFYYYLPSNIKNANDTNINVYILRISFTIFLHSKSEIGKIHHFPKKRVVFFLKAIQICPRNSFIGNSFKDEQN